MLSSAASSSCATWLRAAVRCAVFASLLCASAVSAQFNFTLFNGSLPFEARVDSVIALTRAPLAYTNSVNRIGVAPAGSWLLYGTQEDVWLSSSNGQSWTLLAGQPGNSLPGGDNVTWAATGSGNSGCAHRTTFNRFYWMGTSNQNSAAVGTTATFFNYVSTDGQEWVQIMDAASITAMSARQANEFGICVVDQYERVYSILGADTWMSSNLGVSWAPVASSNRFSVRQDHSGVIYTPSGAVESIVVMAGRLWTPATQYGPDQVGSTRHTHDSAAARAGQRHASWPPLHSSSPPSHLHGCWLDLPRCRRSVHCPERGSTHTRQRVHRCFVLVCAVCDRTTCGSPPTTARPGWRRRCPLPGTLVRTPTWSLRKTA